ncbi:MAG: glycosyltransferase [Afipia sp.]|nr:glycosyltransferase [Afipia sp.]
MSDLAPIVLFIYNRPDHTRRTLAALAANPLASRSDLIVYADGPKKPEHAVAIGQARDVVRNAPGFKSLRMIERVENFGLAKSIITGVSEICAEHGRAIVLEDDLIVAPQFLTFLNQCLERFENETEVMQISGYSFPAYDNSTRDTFFLPMISCWGWATWSAAWAKFDPSMSLLTTLDTNSELRRRFNIDDTYDYYGMACQQRKGSIDSWGVRWQLSLFGDNGLVLYPKVSLVTNEGVDSSGTHGMGASVFQRELSANALDLNKLAWPSKIACDQAALGQVKKLLYANRPGLFHRIIERIRS